MKVLVGAMAGAYGRCFKYHFQRFFTMLSHLYQQFQFTFLAELIWPWKYLLMTSSHKYRCFRCLKVLQQVQTPDQSFKCLLIIQLGLSIKHIKIHCTKLLWSNTEKQNPDGPSGCIDFSHFHDTYIYPTKNSGLERIQILKFSFLKV